jgi:cytosine/creatinine deaminase
MTFDLIVRGGTLPDGRVADIAVRGDRIVATWSRGSRRGGQVIDATGTSWRRPSSTRISTWTRR